MSFAGNQYPSDEGFDLTTKGQIHTHDASSNAALNVGSNTYLLTADSTESTGMKWAASGAAAPTTTKGDISGFSTTQARIPISTNNYSLLADSAQALGLKWAASSTSTLTTTGDLLASSAPNVLTRIAAGASGEVLTGNGAGVLPTFQAAGGGGLWKFQGALTITSSTDETMTLTDQITTLQGFVYCRYLGVGVVGQGADMQVGDNSGLEAGSVYDSIGQTMLATGSTTDYYTLNQVRFTFLQSNLTNSDPTLAEAWIHITSDGRYQHISRISSALGYGFNGGECTTTKSNINKIRLFGDTMTGTLQAWSCETS